MIIGILKEIKAEENRVAMTPTGVEVAVHHGHTVLVERGAGVGSGFSDEAYRRAGAHIVGTPPEIYERADMVMHVKEPCLRNTSSSGPTRSFSPISIWPLTKHSPGSSWSAGRSTSLTKPFRRLTAPCRFLLP